MFFIHIPLSLCFILFVFYSRAGHFVHFPKVLVFLFDISYISRMFWVQYHSKGASSLKLMGGQKSPFLHQSQLTNYSSRLDLFSQIITITEIPSV